MKTLRNKYSFPQFADEGSHTAGVGSPRTWTFVSCFQAQDSFYDEPAAKQTCHLGPPGTELPLNCSSKQRHFSKAEVPHAWRVTAGAWLWSQWPLSSPTRALSFQGPEWSVVTLHPPSPSLAPASLFYIAFCGCTAQLHQWQVLGRPLLHVWADNAVCTVNLQTPANTDLCTVKFRNSAGPGQSLNCSLGRPNQTKQRPGTPVCKILAKAASANLTNRGPLMPSWR